MQTDRKPDRKCCQQKPERGLERERGAHGMPRRNLRHERAELCGVCYDREAPNEGQGDGEREGYLIVKGPAHHQRTDRTYRHRPDRNALATESIRDLPGCNRSDRTHSDDGECRDSAVRTRTRTRAHILEKENRNQAPHRIELPHVPEITGDCKAGLAMTHDGAYETPRERASFERVRSVSVKQQNDHGCSECGTGCRQ